MTGPRTTREALIAEILGDLDSLISRADALPQKMENAGAILEAAGEKYRAAISEFTEQAKKNLSEHFDSKMSETQKLLTEMGEIQKIELQKSAEQAFKSLAPNHIEIIGYAMDKAARKFNKPVSKMLFESIVVAFIYAVMTIFLFAVFQKYFS